MQHAPSRPRLLLALAALCALGAAASLALGTDQAGFVALNGAAARWLPRGVGSNLTLLGHGLVAVMVLATLLPRAPQVLAAGLCAAPVAVLFTELGKRLAARPRPGAVLAPGSFHVEGVLLVGRNAFPSGHSVTVFLLVSVLILGLAPLRRRPMAVVGLLALGLLAAGSRIMVGAHWPADVLAGAALGTLAGLAGHALASAWPHWRTPRTRGTLALVVVACAIGLALIDTGYPLALPLQWTAAAVGASIGAYVLMGEVRALLAPAKAP